MGIFAKIFGEKKPMYTIGTKIAPKDNYRDVYVIKIIRTVDGNYYYDIENVAVSLEKKTIAEYEIERYYRIVG